MSVVSRLEQLCQDKGLKMTDQRRVIARVLSEADDHPDVEQLYRRAAKIDPGISLATVYRTLQQMAADGSIDMLRTAEGEAVYRACSTGHHHHLVCRECGRTVEVEGPAVERWAHKISEEHGFTDVQHTLEIFGTCADCAS